MKSGWPMVLLGEVLSHRKEFVQIDDLQTYKRCRVQLHAQGVVLRDHIPGAEIKTKKQQVCQAGEFLVAEIDAKLGGYGLVPEQLNNAVVSSHYFLFGVNTQRLNREFLGYFIRTPGFFEQVNAQGSTNYAAIRPSHVLGYTIPLPPLHEQRRIVGRIEELETRISEARRLRRAIEETTEVLVDQTGNGLLKNVSGSHRVLGEMVEVRGGGTPSKANPMFWEGQIPWVSPKDMKVRDIRDAADHISEEATQACSAKMLSPGSVLVVIRGMILVHTVPVAVLRVPAAINQDMKALTPKEGLSPEYLCAALWAMNRELLGLVAKSTHDTRKLETHKLLGLEIPVPSVAIQKEFVDYLDGLSAKAEVLKKLQESTAAELDALLPSVLDRAFKGDL